MCEQFEALGALSTASVAILKKESFGSVVQIEVGRSLNRISLIPGIQSRTVSRYPFVRKLSSAKRNDVFHLETCNQS